MESLGFFRLRFIKRGRKKIGGFYFMQFVLFEKLAGLEGVEILLFGAALLTALGQIGRAHV